MMTTKPLQNCCLTGSSVARTHAQHSQQNTWKMKQFQIREWQNNNWCPFSETSQRGVDIKSRTKQTTSTTG
jgi:hypothetical protein